MEKTIRKIITMMTFVALLLGTVQIINASKEVIETSAKIIVSGSEDFYNNFALQSDIVKFFLRQNFVTKTVLMSIAFVMYPLMAMVWFVQIKKLVYKIQRKLKFYKLKKLQKSGWAKRPHSVRSLIMSYKR